MKSRQVLLKNIIQLTVDLNISTRIIFIEVRPPAIENTETGCDVKTGLKFRGAHLQSRTQL